MISLQNISKSYTSKNETVTLFTDLNWQIQTGSYVSLMGASGAGKSSILSLIAGIISPDSGTIELGDTDITQLSTDEMIRYRWQHIAFIFQSFELIPNLTVEENIDLVLDISHAPRRYETSLILDTAILVAMYFRVSAPQITVDVIVGRTNAIHIKNAVCTPLYGGIARIKHARPITMRAVATNSASMSSPMTTIDACISASLKLSFLGWIRIQSLPKRGPMPYSTENKIRDPHDSDHHPREGRYSEKVKE